MLIDASTAAAWLLPSQRTAASEALFLDSASHAFAAPHIFPAEIRNVLLMLERRWRMTSEQTHRATVALAKYGIAIHPPPSFADYDEILMLARDERLTVYDATYLWDAMRASLTLASRDAELLAAASRRRVPVEDLRGA